MKQNIDLQKQAIQLVATAPNLASAFIVVAHIQESSQQLSNSSKELSSTAESSTRDSRHISDNIQDVSNSMSTQLQSIEESSKVMEEMAQGIQRIAESSSSVSETSMQAARAGEPETNQGVSLFIEMNSIPAYIFFEAFHLQYANIFC